LKKRKKQGGKSSGNFKKDLRKEIFHLFKKQGGKAWNYKQISSTLGIQDSGIRKLIEEILREEASNKTLKEVERGKYVATKVKQDTVEGTIQITKHGRGFLIVEGEKDDFEVNNKHLGQSLWGDRVEAVVSHHGRKKSARVVRIIERARKQYVGVVELSRKFAFFLPSDQRIHVDFFVPNSGLNGAEQGDKVLVEIREWDDAEDKPVAEVVKVLGRPGDNDVEMHAILAEFGLPYEFEEDVLADADNISKEIPKEEYEKRRDFRKILTFTIDPEDAKDFDDALSYQKLENGNVEVGIHIADVSFYLERGSILDDEAYQRATSVYLVDRVVPMLPEVLSNELCSLRPKEEKLCFSAVFEMDAKANVVGEWFGRTIIYSDRRFTYEEAQEVIETGKGDHKEAILHLDKLAKALRKERMVAGGIDFDTEEVKFKLDENGVPLYVFTKIMRDSNRLIEDFMLLANRKVAEFIGKPKSGKPKTFVYRVHDNPKEDKLETLRQFVTHFGYKMGSPSKEGALKVLRTLLDESKDKPEEDLIKLMAIRSMAKAEYTTENIGHFGLAFDFYSHFTSPIRRYPDVMVHRLLALYLAGGNSANEGDFERHCKHSSLMEKRAVEAERASIKYKQVQFLTTKLGEEFDGVVSGLSNWGIYVELVESKCEGMVQMANLSSDYFSFDSEKYVIRGNKTGFEYRMGQEVRVRVVKADLGKRQLDFEMLES